MIELNICWPMTKILTNKKTESPNDRREPTGLEITWGLLCQPWRKPKLGLVSYVVSRKDYEHSPLFHTYTTTVLRYTLWKPSSSEETGHLYLGSFYNSLLCWRRSPHWGFLFTDHSYSSPKGNVIPPHIFLLVLIFQSQVPYRVCPHSFAS